MARERAYPTDEKYRNSDNYIAFKERHELAQKLVSGLRVLDTCCGTAYGTYHYIYSFAASVYGADYSLDALKHYDFYQNGLPLVQMDVVQLAFPQNAFDVVLALESIEHFSKDAGQQYIAEISRVLRPGGILFGSTPLCADKCLLPVLQAGNEFHPYPYTRHSLNYVLNKYFDRVNIFEIYNETSPYFIFIAHGLDTSVTDVTNIISELSKPQPDVKRVKSVIYFKWSKALARIGDRKSSVKFAAKSIQKDIKNIKKMPILIRAWFPEGVRKFYRNIKHRYL